jgi:hypothetical protein
MRVRGGCRHPLLGPRDERMRPDLTVSASSECCRVVGSKCKIDCSFHCVVEVCEAEADAAGQGATSSIYSRCDVYYFVTLRPGR